MKKTILAASAAILAISGVAYAAAPDETGGKFDRNQPVTMADAKAKADAMFAKMDVNNDGQINQADRQAKVAEHFAKLDADGNGSLSLEEFSTRPERGKRMRGEGKRGDRMAMHGQRGGERGHHGKRGGMRGHGGMMMMGKMADANNDGTVTKAEFDAAFTKHFSEMDADGDGTVTPEERKAAHEKMREQFRAKKEASAQS